MDLIDVVERIEYLIATNGPQEEIDKYRKLINSNRTKKQINDVEKSKQIKLTDSEKVIIKRMVGDARSIRTIAERLGRSEIAIKHFIDTNDLVVKTRSQLKEEKKMRVLELIKKGHTMAYVAEVTTVSYHTITKYKVELKRDGLL